jgi:L-fuconolactonase
MEARGNRIIDAHHHLWKYNSSDYGWMDDSMEVLKKDYLPSRLARLLTDSGVSGTVVVQARQILEETEWLLKMADEFPFIRGVVGWVDLRSGDLKTQLEIYAAHPRMSGVRHVIHDEPDEDFMLRPAFLKGMEVLQEYGLTYDLLLFPQHLKNALRLVRRFPGTRFVLDHMSKPPIRSGRIHPWKEDIMALAGQPNVWCKVSGMVTEADRNRWRYEDLVPFMEVALEAFGTDRLMAGSDWPVCTLAGTYAEVMAVTRRFFGELSGNEQDKIFMQNAVDCYALEI